MIGIDRRALSIVWTLFLFGLVLTVLYQAGRTIIVFAVAVIFAHLLAPVVSFIESRLPFRLPRVASLSIVYIALIGVIIAISIPLGSRVSHEAASLARKLPDVIQSDPLGNLPIPSWLEPWRPEVTSFVHDRLTEIGQRIGPVLSSMSTQIISGIGTLLAVILIPILAFFFLKDGVMIRDAIVESFPAPRRALVDELFSEVHLLLIQYIRALVLLVLATFTFYAAFLGISGGPFPVLLSFIAALLEFIPVVGPLTGAAILLIVSAANGYHHMLLLVLFLIIYRLFQDYVLNPYVMSAGVELHPLAILFGVLAGAELLGVPGMFFSVPAMAVLRLLINRMRRRQIATPVPSP
jgi:predicted PurR-regulated permease PerM